MPEELVAVASVLLLLAGLFVSWVFYRRFLPEEQSPDKKLRSLQSDWRWGSVHDKVEGEDQLFQRATDYVNATLALSEEEQCILIKEMEIVLDGIQLQLQRDAADSAEIGLNNGVPYF